MTTTKSYATVLLAAGVMALAGTSFAAGADNFRNGQSVYGQPAKVENVGQGSRIVDVATAPYANVRYGETVKFVNGGKSFAWTFDGLDRRAVNLSKVAPQDFDTKSMVVYVGRNPLTRR
jgi:hypothetical protein